MVRLLSDRSRRAVAISAVIGQVALSWPTDLFAQSSSGQATASPKVSINRMVPGVAGPPAVASFSAHPSEAEITRARVFEEPLLATGKRPTAKENEDLASALSTYLKAGVPDHTAEIEDLLFRAPQSPWRPSALVNLATVWRRTGHLSKAYRAWKTAWELTKDRTDPQARAIADRSIGELIEFLSRIGRADELDQLLKSIGRREVRGAATEKISGARQALYLMQHEYYHALRCGPKALDLFLRATGNPAPDVIQKTLAAPEGTSLLHIRELARSVGTTLVAARRRAGAPVIVPAIIHWNMGHFSALVARNGDRFLLRDPTLGELWVTASTLDEEASGYALVSNQPMSDGWTAISDPDAGTVWGKGIVAGADYTDPRRPRCPTCPGSSGPGGPPSNGMAVVSIGMMLVSVIVEDTPAWYMPPKGPAVEIKLTYNQREALQPQTFSYANFGTKWTYDWLSYVTDDPSNPSAAVTVYLRGGGQETSSGFDAETGRYAPTVRDQAVVTRTSTTPVRYEREMPDGSVEVFGQPDGAATFPRKVFLTQIKDAQGNALTLTYDTNLRLVALADALGQVTTFSYEVGADPLKITRITDPFGRTATFGYDGSGRLQQITDLLGLTSSFTYGYADVVATVTTPYGTTKVTWGEETLKRWAEIIDPLGQRERVEYGASVAGDEPMPVGMEVSAYTAHHDTLYWDKQAMATAPGDPAAATDYYWALVSTGMYQSASAPLSIKKPLERRTWYSYQGGGGTTEGTVSQVSGLGRVLDDGTSQVTRTAYNARGRITQRVDPLGRETDYTYDATGLDLLQTKQKHGSTWDILETRTYNSQHVPLTITDAAGQTTTYTYNAAGQVLTITNAKSETTTYGYDSDGYLISITGPLPGATTTFAYDAYGRIGTVTDSEGYAVTTNYDAAGRATQVVYPDGTSALTLYNRLDPAQKRDRLGRWTTYTYDAVRRLTATRDPAGHVVTQEWCSCGSLTALVDANGQRTQWDRDVEGRVVREVRANGSMTQYAYEPTGPRLHQVTDPKGQVTTYTYALDDAVLQTAYTNAAVPTPSVSFTYDPTYSRLATMLDGTGTTTYAYHPVTPGQLGAGQVASVDGPLANDTITYAYDELGRASSRAIDGVAAATVYDALGRTTSDTNVLGTFTYGYVGNSSRLASVTYPNGQTSAYSYFGHGGDDRLQTMHHRYPNGSTLSKFEYTYDAVGNIATWQQQADSAAPIVWRYGYDAADQLMAATEYTTDPTPAVLKRYVYAYDAAGNRTSEQIDDAVTGATYNTMNQLVGQQAAGGILFAGTVNESAHVIINGRSAVVNPDNSFSGTAPVVAGTNTVAITATDPSGNTATDQYQVDSTGPTRAFTYDANGNLTSDGSRSFEWDARNQLVAVTEGSQRAEYSYDGVGRRARIRTLTSGFETGDSQYVWCNGAICEERTGGVVSTRFYSSGVERSGAFYHVRDHLSSIREITNASGTLQGRLEYDPYGSATVVAGAPVAGLGFGGLTLSEFSGIHLAVYRAYDSRLGRWISQDPIGINGGINLYAYVGNGSINAIDPSGLMKMPIGGGKSNCDYYKKKCDDSGACGPKDQYACNAYECCRDFPDTLINRCVRRCLVMMDQVCEKGVCRFGSHVVCYTSCLKFDLWNIPPSCNNVSFGG